MAMTSRDGVEMDIPAVRNIAKKFDKMSDVLTNVSKTLQTLITTLKTTAFVGMVGGYIVAVPALHLTTGTQYWTSAYSNLAYNDIAQGLIKPLIFAIIIATVGCFYGMATTGGTQGVGRSTTRAVVISSIWVFIADLFITRFFVNLR